MSLLAALAREAARFDAKPRSALLCRACHCRARLQGNSHPRARSDRHSWFHYSDYFKWTQRYIVPKSLTHYSVGGRVVGRGREDRETQNLAQTPVATTPAASLKRRIDAEEAVMKICARCRECVSDVFRTVVSAVGPSGASGGLRTLSWPPKLAWSWTRLRTPPAMTGGARSAWAIGLRRQPGPDLIRDTNRWIEALRIRATEENRGCGFLIHRQRLALVCRTASPPARGGLSR